MNAAAVAPKQWPSGGSQPLKCLACTLVQAICAHLSGTEGYGSAKVGSGRPQEHRCPAAQNSTSWCVPRMTSWINMMAGYIRSVDPNHMARRPPLHPVMSLLILSMNSGAYGLLGSAPA